MPAEGAQELAGVDVPAADGLIVPAAGDNLTAPIAILNGN